MPEEKPILGTDSSQLISLFYRNEYVRFALGVFLLSIVNTEFIYFYI